MSYFTTLSTAEMVKVKFALEHDMTAQRGSRGTAIL
jgi:hypothetical protein